MTEAFAEHQAERPETILPTPGALSPRFWPLFWLLSALLGVLLFVAFSLISSPLAFAQGGAPPATPVEVISLESSTLIETLATVGTLRANESVVIRPEIGGRLSKIAFSEGQSVEKGALLFELDDAVQRAQLDQALAQLELRRSDFRRAEALLTDAAISVRERDEAHAQWKLAEAGASLARAQLDKTRIVAPFAGTLGLRSVSEGDYLQPGQTLVNLADSARLKVDFRIPESQATRVRVGQKLNLDGHALSGKLYAIDPIIDAAGRSLVLRGILDNSQQSLRPGQFVNLDLQIGSNSAALMVPEQAVIAQMQKHFVWTVVEGKTAMAPVQLGARRQGFVEVLSGLDEGAQIITGGHQKIGPGMPVTAIPADPSLFARTSSAAAQN